MRKKRQICVSEQTRKNYDIHSAATFVLFKSMFRRASFRSQQGRLRPRRPTLHGIRRFRSCAHVFWKQRPLRAPPPKPYRHAIISFFPSFSLSKWLLCTGLPQQDLWSVRRVPPHPVDVLQAPDPWWAQKHAANGWAFAIKLHFRCFPYYFSAQKPKWSIDICKVNRLNARHVQPSHSNINFETLPDRVQTCDEKSMLKQECS